MDAISGAQGAGAGAGAGLGVLKWLGDIQANKNDRAMSATEAKWSPFTGQKPQATRKANFLQDLLQGTSAGADFGGKNAKTLGSMWDHMSAGGGGGAMPGMGEQDMSGSISPWAAMTA